MAEPTLRKSRRRLTLYGFICILLQLLGQVEKRIYLSSIRSHERTAPGIYI